MKTALLSLLIVLPLTAHAQQRQGVIMPEFTYTDNDPGKYKWEQVCTVKGRIIFNNSIACTDSVIYSFGGFNTEVAQREINTIRKGKFRRSELHYPGLGYFNSLFFIRDSLLFAGGGLDSNQANYSWTDFWQYNFNTMAWKRLRDLAFCYRISPAVLLGDDEVVVMIPQLSGTRFEQSTVQFYRYNIPEDRWTLIKSGNSTPSLTGSPIAFLADHEAFVFFQHQQAYRSPAKDFYKFDLTTGIWTELPPFPGRERTLAFACSDGWYGYVGGGVLGTKGTNATDVYRYHPVSGKWERCPDLPRGLRWSFDGNIYAGFGISDHYNTVTVWKLRPQK